MAWTTPRTWSVGEVPTAANFNTHIRDNVAYLYTNRVAGVVASGGAVGYGSRFTSVKNSTGDYTVTYSVAMVANTAVSVSPESGSTPLVGQIYANTTTGFNVKFYNAASALTDTQFDFIAVAME